MIRAQINIRSSLLIPAIGTRVGDGVVLGAVRRVLHQLLVPISDVSGTEIGEGSLKSRRSKGSGGGGIIARRWPSSVAALQRRVISNLPGALSGIAAAGGSCVSRGRRRRRASVGQSSALIIHRRVLGALIGGRRRRRARGVPGERVRGLTLRLIVLCCCSTGGGGSGGQTRAVGGWLIGGVGRRWLRVDGLIFRTGLEVAAASGGRLLLDKLGQRRVARRATTTTQGISTLKGLLRVTGLRRATRLLMPNEGRCDGLLLLLLLASVLGEERAQRNCLCTTLKLVDELDIGVIWLLKTRLARLTLTLRGGGEQWRLRGSWRLPVTMMKVLTNKQLMLY